MIYLLEEFQNNEFERFSQCLAKTINSDHFFIKDYLKNTKLNALYPKINKYNSSNRSIIDYLAFIHARYYPSLKGRWIQKTFLWRLLAKLKMPNRIKLAKLNESQTKIIQTKYLESNKNLAEFINLDFKKYHYIDQN